MRELSINSKNDREKGRKRKTKKRKKARDILPHCVSFGGADIDIPETKQKQRGREREKLCGSANETKKNTKTAQSIRGKHEQRQKARVECL